MRLRTFVAVALFASSLAVSWAPVPVAASTDAVVFEGAGWGHGVGMSQYGSRAMALEDWTAEEILGHYYQGTTTTDYRQVLSGSWLVTDPEPLWVHVISATQSLRVEATGSGLVFCQQEPVSVGTLSLKNYGSVPSPYVKHLEEALLARGFDPGPVDEVFTTETDAAVRAFQAAQGLAVDGLAGAATKNALWGWDGSDRCVVETPVPTSGLHLMVGADGAQCLVSGSALAGACTGSVRNLSDTARVRIPQRLVRDGSGIELAHGTLRVRPDVSTNGAFQGLHAVVEIGVDDYVLGIDETILSWGTTGAMEALKSQAIASRSFGVASARTRGAEPGFSGAVKDSCWCHLWSTTSSQVYAGWYGETNYGATWRTAATSTSGKVVSHGGAVIQAFFSSSSGGRSESNSAAWGSSQLPYLQSVDDHWSLASGNPNRSWAASFAPASLAAKVGMDQLDGVTVLERNPSGTAKTVRFTGSVSGNSVTVDRAGTWVRSQLGLKSTYFYVEWGVSEPPAPEPPPSPPALPEYPFGDIASSVFRDDIAWLYDRGLTSGCNPPQNTDYCPEAKVTRGEMAVFLERALQLPPSTADHFDDDNGKFYEEAANRIYEAGITSGCGPRAFCGSASLPREQMAAFLDRAFGLGPASQDYFVDDTKSKFQESINRVAEADITKGCNPPANDRFCPTDLVTRGQLAAFLRRALD